MAALDRHSISIVSDFLGSANVSRFLGDPSVMPWIASVVASDYLRKMGVDQRLAVIAWLKTDHPALAAVIAANHPCRWQA